MALDGTTWTTCRDCGKVFGCGCVIHDLCEECRDRICLHEWREFETGPAICTKCFGIRRETTPKPAAGSAP